MNRKKRREIAEDYEETINELLTNETKQDAINAILDIIYEERYGDDEEIQDNSYNSSQEITVNVNYSYEDTDDSPNHDNYGGWGSARRQQMMKNFFRNNGR